MLIYGNNMKQQRFAEDIRRRCANHHESEGSTVYQIGTYLFYRTKVCFEERL